MIRPRALGVLALLLAACGGAPFRDATPPDARGRVAVPGASLPYEVYGAGGDTVLLLAGGPAFPGAVLREVARQLGRQHTAVLYDGRGRGYAVPEPGDTTPPGITADLADLEAFVRHFRLGRFALVAHHYGALLGTSYILRHPGQVTRLALLGPMMPRSGYNYDLAFVEADTVAQRRASQLYASELARQPGPFCRATWGWMLAPAPELDPRVLDRVAPAACEAPDAALARVGSIKQQVLTSLAAWDYRGSIAQLRLPVLVLQGDRNRVLQHSGANWAYRAPEGLLLTVRGSAFFPWVTDPVRTASGLEAFLAGRQPEGARRPLSGEVLSPDDSLRQTSATKSPPAP